MRRTVLICLPLLLLVGCGTTDDEPSAAERAAQLSAAIGTTSAPPTTTAAPATPTGYSYEDLAALDGQPCTTPGEVADLPVTTASSSYSPIPAVSSARVCAGDGVWARLAAPLDQCFATDTQRYADTGGTVLACVSSQLWVPGQTNSGPLGVNTYEVGTGTGQVVPGTYVATDVRNCYWERLDAAGEIIDNNFIDGAPRAEFTVSSSDYALNIDGCAGWTLVG